MGCVLLDSGSAVFVASTPNSSSSASIHVDEKSEVVGRASVCDGALVKSRPTRSASSEIPKGTEGKVEKRCRSNLALMGEWVTKEASSDQGE